MSSLREHYGILDVPALEGGVQGPPQPAWLSLVEDGAAILGEDLPAVVEIVKGIVAEGSKLLIASGSKSFKTWLTIHMGLCIACGLPLWGRQVCQRRVLYVNLELKPVTFKRRVQDIAKYMGIDIPKGQFLTLPLRGRLAHVSVDEIVSRIIEIAKQHQIGVVIIDPIYKMNLEGDENSSRDQTVFFNQLDRITTEAGCTLIINDHFGKGNQSEKEALDSIRGSSAKGGDIDAAMILRKHEVEQCFRVDMVHRELPPVDPFCIQWRFPVMELRADLDASAMKRLRGGQSKKHDPLDLLGHIRDRTEEKPISVSEWAERAGISRQTLQGYLPDMTRQGWIKTVGEGSSARKCITAAGHAASGDAAVEAAAASADAAS